MSDHEHCHACHESADVEPSGKYDLVPPDFDGVIGRDVGASVYTLGETNEIPGDGATGS